MNTTIIRTNGSVEKITLSRDTYTEELMKILDAEVFDVVNLRDGRVMFVDDLGWNTTVRREAGEFLGMSVSTTHLEATTPRKPINPKATELYHSICVPGTTHQIVGDVAVMLDDEFED